MLFFFRFSESYFKKKIEYKIQDDNRGEKGYTFQMKEAKRVFDGGSHK
jgi:hypothetical protein